ncbi:MAG TPA: hypothetical protein PLV93_00210 [Microthrixaceae bacterium]|nr:hypothetical protein [Microthrixaceae bacterium]HNI33783.1 hypothetical protein [Microthrixaceae bacterium]
MILRAHSFVVDVPRGWDARIFRRAESEVTSPSASTDVAGLVPQSGVTTPILHLGSFPLPNGRGDYGSGAVGLMRPSDVFIALVQFGPESMGTPLFQRRGMPTFRSADLSEAAMQRPIVGMGGAQRFFNVSGRPFCCYAVVGSLVRRSSLVASLNGALGRITVLSA